jgi:hypothetical protein
MKPSEYFAKHCVIASDSDDEFVASTVAAVGSDHVAWSSDFPHLEARWPDGVEIFDTRAGFDAQTRASVMWRTPCRLYGIDPDRPALEASGSVMSALPGPDQEWPR